MAKRNTVGLGFYFHDIHTRERSGPFWGPVKKTAKFIPGLYVHGADLPSGVSRALYEITGLGFDHPDDLGYRVNAVGREGARVVVHLS